jgi:hypothetical protein
MLHSIKILSPAVLATTVLSLATMLPSAASAQTASSQAQPGAWNFTATLYGWFPSISGTTIFPVDSNNSITADSGDIIDNLKFAFMGSLDAHNGRWGAFTDVVYVNVTGDASQTRNFSLGNAGVPVGTSADLNLGIKGWVWTLAGEYRVASTSQITMDVLFGARMLNAKETLNYSLFGNIGSISAAGRSGNQERSETIWDGIVGVKGRLAFGDDGRWLVPYYADVGTGGSDVTWQAAIGIGYAFRWGDVVAMYRYLDYNMKSGKSIQDLKLDGPMVGVAFHW